MATWRLGWHMTVMVNYLYNHCQADPVLKAVCNLLHGAIRESRMTSSQVASMAIAVQCRMILDASTFRDCRPLRATLLSTPFVGSSLFGGQFQSSVGEAMSSKETLTQVRRLASSGSLAAQGTCGPIVTQQSQKRRAAPRPPPPPTAQSVPSGDGGSAPKRHLSKNRGANRRSGGAPAQSQAQQGARRQGVSNKRPPVRRQAVVFSASLATNNLGQIYPGGYQTGVHPLFCEASPFVSVSCVDTVSKAAVQTTGAVGRGFVPPEQGGHGDCRSVPGPGGILFPLLPGHQAHWWVPPHPQPTRSQLVYSSGQILHGDPDLNSSGSSQRLVVGVVGSQGRLFACTDTPQSLAVSSVCSQEPGRGAHCLSIESTPFWFSHCPTSFYQTPGSVSRDV